MKHIPIQTYLAIITILLCVAGVSSTLTHIQVQRHGDMIKATLVSTATSYTAKKGPLSTFQYGETRFKESLGHLYKNHPGDTFSFYHHAAHPNVFISTKTSRYQDHWDLGICLFMILVSIYLLIHTYYIGPKRLEQAYGALKERDRKRGK